MPPIRHDHPFHRRREEKQQLLRKRVVLSSQQSSKTPFYKRIIKGLFTWRFWFRCLEFLGLLLIIPTACVMWIDLEDRQQQRLTNAWQLVTTKAPGNSGKREALEYLNKAQESLPTAILKSLNNHLGWELDTQYFERIDKKRTVLDGIDLSVRIGAEGYLEKLNLTNAKLVQANFSGASLIKSSLSRSNLSKINLSKTNLLEADLYKSLLYEADLSSSNLTAANLSLADLEKANLTNAVLENAKLIGTDLSYTNVTRANFRGANLTGAILDYTDLDKASDLSEVNFSHTDLQGIDLPYGYLRYSDFSSANLGYANFFHAYIWKAKFVNTNLYETNLTNALLHHSDFSKAKLQHTKLTSANLRNTNLSHADLSTSHLSNAFLSGATLTRIPPLIMTRMPYDSWISIDYSWPLSTSFSKKTGMWYLRNSPPTVPLSELRFFQKINSLSNCIWMNHWKPIKSQIDIQKNDHYYLVECLNPSIFQKQERIR